MNRQMRAALVAGVMMVLAGEPVLAETPGDYEVWGVEGEDMLKMRAGPGVGYRVIVGLPNGTVVRVQSCEQTGSTRWCKASLNAARGLKGYVSRTYLREN